MDGGVAAGAGAAAEGCESVVVTTDGL